MMFRSKDQRSFIVQSICNTSMIYVDSDCGQIGPLAWFNRQEILTKDSSWRVTVWGTIGFLDKAKNFVGIIDTRFHFRRVSMGPS
jgi:hypothetical protein